MLRTRVAGCQRSLTCHRIAIGIDELGDAKVEQFYAPLVIDKDVGRLEIAVHNQSRMRMGNRIDNVDEHPDTRSSGQVAARRELGHRDTLNELHDNVGPALFGDTCVEELRDVGVIQPSEHLLLLQEQLPGAIIDTADRRHLDGHLAIEAAVAAHGAVHPTHTAFGDECLDLIVTEGATQERIGLVGANFREQAEATPRRQRIVRVVRGHRRNLPLGS